MDTKTNGENDCVKIEAEIRVTLLHPPEAERGKEASLPRGFRGRMILPTS